MYLRILLVSLILNLFNSQLLANTIKYNKTIPENNYFNLINKEFSQEIKSMSIFKVRIENDGTSKKELYIGLKDNKTEDYWGQFTHKTTLQKGLNEITVNLNRFVGERGSQPNKRFLNRNKLKEAFIVFNPDMSTTSEKIKLLSLEFITFTQPQLPSDADFFIFGDIDSEIYPFAKIIKSKSMYSSSQAGFEKIDLWRERDAKISPKALSQTISVKEADFSINLAKGDYTLELIWDELGYWEIPFWNLRKLSIGGKPVLIETRATWDDFLNDLYMFKGSRTKPFDALLGNVFKPQVIKYKHAGGKLTLSFEGDASGVSLNTLLIYPNKNKEIATFKKNLIRLYQNEFDSDYREVSQSAIKAEPSIELTNIDLISEKCESNKKVEYAYFESELYLVFCLTKLKGEEVNISLDSKLDFQIYKGKQQYKSLDLNHESFTNGLSHFEPANKKINIESNKEIILIQLKNIPPKTKQINIDIKAKSAKLKKTLRLKKLKNKFSKLPIDLNLFGPSIVPFTYFEGKNKKQWIDKINSKTYNILAKHDINNVLDSTIIKLKYNKNYEQFKLDITDKFENSAYSYFYQAKALRDIINGNLRNSSQSEEIYQKNLSNEIASLQKRNSKKFVYLYSDEASGYRNAINEDLSKIWSLKKQLPGFYLGGFGNLYDFEKAKKLYEAWDIGFYTDIPNIKYIKTLNEIHTSWGIYNLCAEISAPLRICYGVYLYKLYKAGVKHFVEWHLNSSQNYPYYDLDGREADIAFLVSNKKGDVFETSRFRQLQAGLNDFKKLINLDTYFNNRKVLGLSETKAKKWLESVEKKQTFPVKQGIEKLKASDMSNFYRLLDDYSIKFLSNLR